MKLQVSQRTWRPTVLLMDGSKLLAIRRHKAHPYQHNARLGGGFVNKDDDSCLYPRSQEEVGLDLPVNKVEQLTIAFHPGGTPPQRLGHYHRPSGLSCRQKRRPSYAGDDG